MATKKRVLIIGFDPRQQDFSSPELAAHGLTRDKILDGIRVDHERIEAAGYDLDQCLVIAETAEAEVARRLREKTYDCILFGAGIRTRPDYLLLFERLLNLVHERAPHARLCFNTSAGDSLEGIKRWT